MKQEQQPTNERTNEKKNSVRPACYVCVTVQFQSQQNFYSIKRTSRLSLCCADQTRKNSVIFTVKQKNPKNRGKMSRSGKATQLDADVVDKGSAKMPKFVENQMARPRPLSELNGNRSRCICERPLTPLLCTHCMKPYFGRIGRTCTEHPNVSNSILRLTSGSDNHRH